MVGKFCATCRVNGYLWYSLFCNQKAIEKLTVFESQAFRFHISINSLNTGSLNQIIVEIFDSKLLVFI